MIQYQIIDLDGCISDDRWRRPFIKPRGPERFTAYHAACPLDAPMNLHELVKDLKLIIITGRQERWRSHTESWLWEYASRIPSYLIMRREEDEGLPSLMLKRRVVGDLFDPEQYNLRREQIVSAIDDRADIVEMYVGIFGLPARIVRIGDEEHENG